MISAVNRALAALSLALLAACATPRNADEIVRGKAWAQVLDRTDVTYLGGPTFRAEASTPFKGSVDEMEMSLLARAAGEAVASGADRFVLTYVDYDEAGLSLVPDMSFPEARWIGSYSELLEARAEVDGDDSLDGPFGYKSMVAVIRLLAADEELGREAFEAAPLYDALLADRVRRKGISARGLRVPRLGF